MQKIKEGTYKIVSVSAATLDTIGKPVVKCSHKLLIEGSNDLESSIETFLDEVQSSWYSPTKLMPYLKKANSAFHQLTRSEISRSYEGHMSVVSGLESYLTAEQQQLENYLARTGSKVHHNWVFSHENRQTLQELMKLIKSLTKNLSKLKYSQIWKYCMSFVCIQKAGRELAWEINCITIDEKLLEGIRQLKYYCRYAVAVYGKYLVSILIEKKWKNLIFSDAEERIFCNYVGIPDDQLVYSHMLSRKNIPSHTISIDYNMRAIVITIRGTNSLFDCMTDLKSHYQEFLFTNPVTGEHVLGFVHCGIMQSAQELSMEIKAIVLSCVLEYVGFSVVVVGHSLGAGISTCLSLLWLGDVDFINTSLTAFTYGPVQVLSASLNELLKEKVFSCVYGNDIICRLSLGNLQDFAWVIQEIHRMEGCGEFGSSELVNKWFFEEKVDYREVVGKYLEVRKGMNAEKLQLTGRILQVYKREKHSDWNLMSCKVDEYSFAFVHSDFYNEIILDKNCFWDHMPDTYEDIIVSLPLDLQQLNYFASS